MDSPDAQRGNSLLILLLLQKISEEGLAFDHLDAPHKLIFLMRVIEKREEQNATVTQNLGADGETSGRPQA